MPHHSSMDIIIAVAHGLTHAPIHPYPASSLLPLADSHRQHLLQLADIFQQHTQRPDHVQTEPPADLPSRVPASSTFPIITLSPTWDSSSPTAASSTDPVPIPRVATPPPSAPTVAPTSTVVPHRRVVLNYSHSHNPTRVRAYMHRHVRVLREPHSSEE
jgi:hypothetical protein